jgi:hypothetical protein
MEHKSENVERLSVSELTEQELDAIAAAGKVIIAGGGSRYSYGVVVAGGGGYGYRRGAGFYAGRRRGFIAGRRW